MGGQALMGEQQQKAPKNTKSTYKNGMYGLFVEFRTRFSRKNVEKWLGPPLIAV